MQFFRSTPEFAKSISVIVALSVVLVFVSHTLTFGHLAESIHNQYAAVRGEPFILDGKPSVIHPFYNRILFPSVFVFAATTLRGWTDVQIFLLLRFLSFLICLSAIYIAVYRRSNSLPRALTVCSVLAISMIPTFSHGWVHTSDIFDLTFCFFMFLFIAEGRFMPAFFVACLTAVNRETGAFGSVAYLCMAVGGEKLRLIALKVTAMGLIPYIGAVLLRKIILGDQLALESTGQWYTGLSYNFALLIEAVRHPSPIGWPALLFAMMALPWLLFLSQNHATGFKIRAAIGFVGIFAVTAAVGINAEVRTFIPCIALLFACTVALPTSRVLVNG